MSQFYQGVTSGALPPDVPLEFTTDDGIAVPVANNLNVLGRDTTENDVDGIRTNADPDGSDNLYIELTNRITGSATTTDGVTPVPLITPFNLGATPSTYVFTIYVSAYNATDSLSAGYVSYRTVRATGAAAVAIGATIALSDEEGAMSGILVTDGESGNTITLTATGLVGKTINYATLITYIKV